MSDKIVVTLQELLDIANQELARRPECTLGSSVSKVSKGVGTFSLKIAGEAGMPLDSREIAKFAQSLYDRYLLRY
jgi:hypothetical protein